VDIILYEEQLISHCSIQQNQPLELDRGWVIGVPLHNFSYICPVSYALLLTDRFALKV
jgi:hypothetical protein